MINQLRLPQQQTLTRTAIDSYVCLAVGLLALSFAPIFVRLSAGELSPLGIIFNRFWMATIVLGILHEIPDSNQSQSDLEKQVKNGKTVILLLLLGTFFSLGLILWAWSLTQTTIAKSTIMSSLTPGFTALGWWLIWGKRPDKRFLIGMGVTMVGVMSLGVSDFCLDSGNIEGDAIALLSAVLFSAYPLILEQLQKELNSKTILMWCCLMGTVFIFSILLITGERLFPVSWNGWLGVISLALLCQVLGLVLIAECMKQLSAVFVSVSYLFLPVLSSIYGWVFFAESLSFYNWLGFALVLLGIYVAKKSQTIVKTVDG
ncbi:MAG: DMT family transporter [Gomphosphaeria aponina SAG 52.96 = DSM 107014]|uniref:DMT family transporter n=1 Tax=Gomphosphaeria aponina SAG 52.96 = DSM 107014 TaxID=1521640 RepID=A0A941GWP8_9CHRO|nr:DMT family transporter [Gomphosphaeria aponina SAG 52.96 = DSM 107014]